MSTELPLSDLRLSHYSNEALGEIRSTEQKWRREYRSSHEKPKGLWVSVDGEYDWAAWCKSEDYGLGAVRHRVTVADWSRLLLLKSCGDLREFTKRYGLQNERWNDTYIDWPTVAAAYGGLVIAPYCWDLRMDLDWYYGWDCASGCIWDASVIERIEVLQEAQAA